MQREIEQFTTLIRRLILRKLKKPLKLFIKQHYEKPADSQFAFDDIFAASYSTINFNFKEILKQQEPTFSETLFKLIDERGMRDSEVYGKVGIDRRLFSKIRIHPDYKPAKTTVLLFAIALELTVDETKELLATAGYTLSRSIMQDLIFEFFISHGIYDLMTINEALYDCGEKTIGV